MSARVYDVISRGEKVGTVSIDDGLMRIMMAGHELRIAHNSYYKTIDVLLSEVRKAISKMGYREFDLELVSDG